MCPHFGLCGGCSRQDLEYPVQLQKKEAVVRKVLSQFSIEQLLPILPSPETSFFRNKMEFSFGDQRDVEILKNPRPRGSKEPFPPLKHLVHLGLHPKGRFAIATPTPECELLSIESNKILALVSDWATENNIPVYTRKDAQGCLRHLVIREGKNTGERMVKLVATSATPHVEKLAAILKSHSIPITTFFWEIHDGLSDVAHGSDRKIFWGEGWIREKMGDLVVKVMPSSFMQTNTHAAEQMLDILKSWAKTDFSSSFRVVDLYCGSGVIGLHLAGRDQALFGIELNPLAIQEAERTAAANGFSNAKFQAGSVQEIFQQDEATDDSTLVVVDPPRPGLHPNVVRTLVESAPRCIYYVSCNVESLARDLQGFDSRYRIHAVQPMDFFPHTDHIETAVHLLRR